MKLKRYSFFFLVFVCSVAYAQTKVDSLTITGIKWETAEVQRGIVRKHAQVPLLYKCVQNINIVEVDLKKCHYKTSIVVTVPNKITSEAARAEQAIAAINGSFFDVVKGNSVCYLKVGKQVIDTTTAFEFSERVTGAIFGKNGQIKIKPWAKANEKLKYNPKETILASGPLMLNEGKVCDFSKCNKKFIETKHPRSAIAITRDGKLILITIDGRFPKQAEGINIPELTHLLKVLGGKYALNLDGGGSATIWTKDAPENGVLNTPYDNKKFDHYGERAVANLIVIK